MEVLKRNAIKAYKVFNSDWTCIGFKYQVGESYKHEGEIKPCKSGFHCCKKLIDCFNYYEFNPKNKVAEVLIWGRIEKHDDKFVASQIQIIRELNWYEVLDSVNTGKYNTGKWNSGNWNSGDWNSGDRNSGNFNTEKQNMTFCFNKLISKEVLQSTVFPDFCYFELNIWIPLEDMAEEEKLQHPESSILGGYLRQYKYKEAFRNSFLKAKQKSDWKGQLQILKQIPNFDADIFYEISGIKPEELN